MGAFHDLEGCYQGYAMLLSKPRLGRKSEFGAGLVVGDGLGWESGELNLVRMVKEAESCCSDDS